MTLYLFICCGLAGSGKSTTAQLLQRHLTDTGLETLIISDRDGRNRRTRTSLEYIAYRWADKAEIPVCIIDGGVANAFDRQSLISSVEEAAGENMVKCIAIQHDRSDRWLMTVAGKALAEVRSSHTLWQPPIKLEGFDMIYHVRGIDYLNLIGLLSTANRVLGSEFVVPAPIKPTPVDEEAVS